MWLHFSPNHKYFHTPSRQRPRKLLAISPLIHTSRPNPSTEEAKYTNKYGVRACITSPRPVCMHTTYYRGSSIHLASQPASQDALQLTISPSSLASSPGVGRTRVCSLTISYPIARHWFQFLGAPLPSLRRCTVRHVGVMAEGAQEYRILASSHYPVLIHPSCQVAGVQERVRAGP